MQLAGELLIIDLVLVLFGWQSPKLEYVKLVQVGGGGIYVPLNVICLPLLTLPSASTTNT